MISTKWVGVCVLCLLLVPRVLFAQVFIEEDFVSGSLPAGWTNNRISGVSTDEWKYNNPGSRAVTSPITSPFAIFDAANYSSANGAEVVSLESPSFDGSNVSQIVLEFNHLFSSGSGAKGIVEVFDGSAWHRVDSTTSNGTEKKTLDITTHATHANAKVRFRWTGNGAGYWMIDNVVVVAPIHQYSHFQNFDSWSAGVSNTQDGWEDSSDDDFDWTVQKGSTPSGSTGPNSDVSGSGNYLFIEASSPQVANDSAVLLSPYFNLEGIPGGITPKLTWFYNMNGSEMGTLNLFIQQDLRWNLAFTQTGNKGTAWKADTQLLDTLSGLVRFKFVGIRGNGFRSDLAIDEVNLVALSNLDAGVTQVLSPQTGCALSGTEKVKVVVRNFGSTAITTIPLSFSVNGAAINAVETLSTNLGAGDTLHHLFNATAGLAAIQHHGLTARTLVPFDANPSNDSVQLSLTNYDLVQTFPYRIDFDNWPNGNGSEADKWVQQLDDQRNWVIDTGPGFQAPNTGPGSGDVDGTGKYLTIQTIGMSNGDSAVIETPCIDLDSLNSTTPVLQFYRHMFGSSVGFLRVRVVHGNTMTQVFEQSGSSGDVWIKESIDLSAFSGSIRIRFVGHRGGNGFGDIALDNIEVKHATGFDLTTQSILGISTGCDLSNQEQGKVVIKNSGDSTISGLRLQVRVDGVLEVNDSITRSLSPNDTFHHLLSQTLNLSDTGNYNIQVSIVSAKDDNPDDDTLQVLVRNRIVIGTSDLPYTQNFDGFPEGTRHEIGGDWVSQLGQGLANWDVEFAGTATSNTGPQSDNTTGNGHYVYYERDNDLTADSAVLLSPCLDLTGVVQNKALVLQFFRSMFGSHITHLHVDVHNGHQWVRMLTKSGDEGTSAWFKEDVFLDTFQHIIQVRFVVNKPSGGTRSDIGIDDISLLLFEGLDVAVGQILEPSDGCGMTTETVKAVFHNVGDSSVSHFQVQVLRNDTLQFTDTVTQTIQPGDSVTFTFTQKVGAGPVGHTRIAVKTLLIKDDNTDNDTNSVLIENRLLIDQFPYVQSFDTWPKGHRQEDDGWDNLLGNGVQWIVEDFAAGFNNTGPSDDITGGGNYVYFPSGTAAGSQDSVMIITPCIDLSGLTRPEMRFFSHMFGSSIGGLAVDVLDGNGTTRVFSKSGNQGDFYVEERVDLSAFNGVITIMFVAKELINSSLGEIAIDQVSIIDASGQDIDLIETLGPLSDCGLGNETVSIKLANVGDSAITNLPLSYTVNGGTAVNQTLAGPLQPGDTVVFDFSQKADLSTAGNYDLKVFAKGAQDDSRLNDTLEVQVTSKTSVAQFDHLQDFDSWSSGNTTQDGWEQLTNDDLQWTVDANGTPSGNTGPADDRDGGGNYLFLEASGPATGDSAVLRSPCVDLTGISANVNIHFSYHMFGATMGTLKVFLENGTNQTLLFTETGNQGNQWHDTTFNMGSSMNGNIVNLRFVAIRGSNFTSDMAIDNFRISIDGALDVAPIALLSLQNGVSFGNAEVVQVRVANLENAVVNNIPVNLLLNGQSLAIDTIASMAANDTVQHTFSQLADLSSEQVHGLTVITTLNGDLNGLNDTLNSEVIHHQLMNEFPYVQNFDALADGDAFQAEWQIGDGNFNWEVETEPNSPFTDRPVSDGNNGVKYHLARTKNQAQNDSAVLFSPFFDFSTLSPQVDFYVDFHMAARDASFGELKVWAIRNGKPDSVVFSRSTQTSSGNFESMSFFIKNQGDTVRFKFVARKGNATTNAQWIAIDLFRLRPFGQKDIEVVAITEPKTDYGLGSENITIRYRNVGQQTLLSGTQIPFSYQVDGGSVVNQTHTLSNDLPADSSIQSFVFITQANFSTNKTYTISVFANMANDFFEVNDTTDTTLISVATITGFPYKQDFENGDGTFFGTNRFEHGVPNSDYIHNAASGTKAFVTELDGDVSESGTSSLFTPLFDFTALNADPVLKFAFKSSTSSTVNRLRLFSKEDGSGSRSSINTNYTSENWHNTDNGAFDSWSGNNPSDSHAWDTARIELIGFKGKKVRFELEYTKQTATPDEGFGIDDFQIELAPAHDLGIRALTPPTIVCGMGQDTLKADVRNFGNNNETGFLLAYRVNGGVVVQDTFTDTLLPGETRQFVFSQLVDYSNAGNYQIQAFTQHAQDADFKNDTFHTGQQFRPAEISSFPYVEDFEAGDGGWRSIKEDADEGFEHGIPSGTKIHSAGSGNRAWVTDLSGDLDNDAPLRLLSPCFDFSGFLVDPELSFLHNFDLKSTVFLNNNVLFRDGSVHILEMSTDGGLTFSKLGDANGSGVNWYNDVDIVCWNDSSSGWRRAVHRLTGAAGKSGVQLRFSILRSHAGSFEGVGIDSISVGLPTTPDLRMVEVEELLTGFSSSNNIRIKLANVGGTSEHGFDVKYEIDGTPIAQAETINDTLDPGDTLVYAFVAKADLSSNGLTEIKAYHTNSNDGNPNNDTAVVQMKASATFTAPYIQNFTSFPTGTQFIGGWIQDAEGGQPHVKADSTGRVNEQGSGGTKTGPLTDFSTFGKLLFYQSTQAELGDSDVVYSPIIDISALSNPKLKFKVHLFSQPSLANFLQGSLRVYGLNANNQWTLLSNFDENSGNPDGSFDPDNDQWDQVEVNISSLPNITRFKFVFKNRIASLQDPDNNLVLDQVDPINFAIDNFEVTGDIPFDVGVVAIDSPRTSCSMGFENIAIQVANFGTQTVTQNTQVPCNFRIDGGTVATNAITLNQDLDPGDTVQLIFQSKGDFRTLKTYTVEAWTSLNADSINVFNDTFLLQLSHVGGRSTFPYITDFESGLNDWVIGGNNADWERDQLSAQDNMEYFLPEFNATTALFTNHDGNAGNQTSFITSPCMDFSGMTNDPRIRFDLIHELAARNIGSSNLMYFRLEVSTDAGQTYAVLTPSVQSKNFYNDVSNNRFTATHGSSFEWIECMNVLTGMAGESSVQIRFAFGQNINTQIEGIGLDNIVVEESPTVDLDLISLLKPETGFAKIVDSVRIQCMNRGVGTIAQGTNIAISYQKNGGTVVTENTTVPKNIGPGQRVEFVFANALNVATDTFYQVKAWAKLGGDTIPPNDTLERRAINQPIIDRFPSNTAWLLSPEGWFSYGEFNSWEFGRPTAGAMTNLVFDTVVWATNLDGNHNHYEKSYLESPLYDFRYVADDPEIGFLLSTKTVGNQFNALDRLHLEVSTDAGTTWTKIDANDSAVNWYNNTTSKAWDGTSSGPFGTWVVVENNLPNLKGERRVKFRFVFESNDELSSDGVGLDLFVVQAAIKNDLQLQGLVNPIPNARLHLDKGVSFRLKNNHLTDTAFLQFDTLKLKAEITFPDASVDSMVRLVTGLVLNPGESRKFILDSNFTLQDTGLYRFACTIEHPTDTHFQNDSLFFVVKQRPRITPKASFGAPQRDTAGRSETNDEWTYYYDHGPDGVANTEDDILVLGLKLNGNAIGTLGDGTFKVVVSATGGDANGQGHVIDTLKTGGGSYPSNPNGWTVMPRYWDVTPTQQPDSAVSVRFFYTQEDFDDLNATLQDSLGGNAMNAHNEMVMYKISNHDPDPLTGHAGVRGFEVTSLTHGNAPSTSRWVHGVFNGLHYAEFEVTSFSGGGGGIGGDGGGPLPVDLTYFRAQWVASVSAGSLGMGTVAEPSQSSQIPKLSWQTAQEIDNSHFEIERSFDGENWETLSRQDGQGNSTRITDYEYRDRSLTSTAGSQWSTVYYRLKQVDFSGGFEYSAIRTLKINQETSEYEVYPNPVQERLYISGVGRETLTFSIFSMQGEKVRSGVLPASQTVYVSDLRPGQYILTLGSDRQHQNIMITVLE